MEEGRSSLAGHWGTEPEALGKTQTTRSYNRVGIRGRSVHALRKTQLEEAGDRRKVVRPANLESDRLQVTLRDRSSQMSLQQRKTLAHVQLSATEELKHGSDTQSFTALNQEST